jgi:hypothetical protein
MSISCPNTLTKVQRDLPLKNQTEIVLSYIKSIKGYFNFLMTKHDYITFVLDCIKERMVFFYSQKGTR